MFKTALLALLCLALRCTVIALPLLEAHLAPATIMAPPPIHQPPTLDHPNPTYYIPLRNRRMMMRFTPGDNIDPDRKMMMEVTPGDNTDPSRKLWRNVKNPPVRKPTAEEEETIHYYLKHYPNAQAYVFDSDGILLEKPKENCTPRYYCGRVDFYGQDGSLLHSTHCCYWNSSTCTPKLNNGAECLISTAVSCPFFVCAAILDAIRKAKK